LNELYKVANSSSQSDQGALERIFAAGFVEFVKLKKQHGVDASAVMEARAALCARLISADGQAGIASGVSRLGRFGQPYVGLFGTVWGIMTRFRGWRTWVRRPWRTSRPASPKHWWRPRWLVRGDSGGGSLQPLRARNQSPFYPLRQLHRRILQRAATPAMKSNRRSTNRLMNEINVVHIST